MELIIYKRPFGPQTEEHGWRPRWLRRWRGRLKEFERWAAPPTAPERANEQERSFVPVAVLLGLALLVQYAQVWIPSVGAYLVDRNPLYWASWAGFTLFKQWGLFVLMLLALRIKEERLAGIGFPALNARRISLALALVGFSLGLAVVRSPGEVADAASGAAVLPGWPIEGVLFVLLAVTAGIMEETFFRGFAIVWTFRWGRHLPLAVLFPAAVFAAGHAYRGWLNVVFAFVVALGFSLLFLWRRDLYWPMVLHFLVNVRDVLT